MVYNYLPLMIFPLFVALDRLDPALREASKDLVRAGWKTFRQVTLPLARPASPPGCCWCSSRSPATTSPPRARWRQGNMVGALVASQFQAAQNRRSGSAMAVVLIAMIMLTIG